MFVIANIPMDSTKYTTISVTRTNYAALRELGKTGDTFNGVIDRALVIVNAIENHAKNCNSCKEHLKEVLLKWKIKANGLELAHQQFATPSASKNKVLLNFNDCKENNTE